MFFQRRLRCRHSRLLCHWKARITKLNGGGGLEVSARFKQPRQTPSSCITATTPHLRQFQRPPVAHLLYLLYSPTSNVHPQQGYGQSGSAALPASVVKGQESLPRVSSRFIEISRISKG
jgi:hypothetical protein